MVSLLPVPPFLLNVCPPKGWCIGAKCVFHHLLLSPLFVNRTILSDSSGETEDFHNEPFTRTPGRKKMWHKTGLLLAAAKSNLSGVSSEPSLWSEIQRRYTAVHFSFHSRSLNYAPHQTSIRVTLERSSSLTESQQRIEKPRNRYKFRFFFGWKENFVHMRLSKDQAKHNNHDSIHITNVQKLLHTKWSWDLV